MRENIHALVYPDSFEEKIGFAQIRQKVSDLCTTPMGAELAGEMHAAFIPEAVSRWLTETVEFEEIIRHYPGFPEIAPVDIRSSIRKGLIPGSFLDIPEWLDIRRILLSVRQMEVFFQKAAPEILPSTRARASQMKTFPFIQERIDQVFGKTGAVRDQASPELRRIRQEMAHLQSSMGRRMENVLQQARNDGWIEKDAQATIRDGRLVVPVPVSNKRRIKGLIHDESATGRTAFIEPMELVEMNNELRELELDEQREIIRILTELTDQMRPYFPEMESWNRVLAEFDLTRARARLSIQWEGKPVQLKDEPMIDWEGARHPLLDLVFRAEKKRVVPQDIRLDSRNRILVISGPNAGGKSVCLKSTGLIQYLIQCGFTVPVKEGSRSGIFDTFLLDIGDEQSIEDDLSTYSSHLHHMKFFLRKAGERSLFLIDEFGAGTEPQLGGAIAESILDELSRSGAFGVVTTHYSNLKHFAASAAGVVNAAMRYDVNRMQPLFELEIGKPGSSFAFEIARNIGLPDAIIRKASDLVGDHHIQFDKHLREISRDKRYWETKREKIRQESKEIGQLLEKYSDSLAVTEKERKKVIQETRRRSEEILSGINRQIEQSIREIRESQAEKQKVKEVRETLEALRESVRKEIEGSLAEGKEKVEKADRDAIRVKKKIRTDAPPAPVAKPAGPPPVVAGCKVRLKDRDILAEVLENRGSTLLVAMGQMITTVPADRTEVVSNKEFLEATGTRSYGTRFAGVDLEQRRLSFSPSLDVRGMRAEEAIRKVTEFIDEAVMVGANDLRILHGKGDGILRQIIREYLSGVDVVSRFEDEDVRFGGTGITLVRLAW